MILKASGLELRIGANSYYTETMQEPKPVIRPWITFGALLVLAASLLAVREFQVSQQIRQLRTERQQWVEQTEGLKTRIQQAEMKVAETEERLGHQSI